MVLKVLASQGVGCTVSVRERADFVACVNAALRASILPTLLADCRKTGSYVPPSPVSGHVRLQLEADASTPKAIIHVRTDSVMREDSRECQAC